MIKYNTDIHKHVVNSLNLEIEEILTLKIFIII